MAKSGTNDRVLVALESEVGERADRHFQRFGEDDLWDLMNWQIFEVSNVVILISTRCLQGEVTQKQRSEIDFVESLPFVFILYSFI